jgi:single-strand DNA-binding protein
MANVQVIQRHAHLAAPVKLEYVNGRDGQIAKAVFIAITNRRRGTGDAREEESTAIQWTLWGKQAENAAEYLGKGSHVNVIGRLRNNVYEKDGEQVFGFTFTADEIDYLDSRAQSEARRRDGDGTQGGAGTQGNADSVTQGGAHRNRKPRAEHPRSRA